MNIRAETPEDYPAVRQINEQAFGRSAEADLVDALRRNARPYLSLVAEMENKVLGHIFFSPVSIETDAPAPASLAFGLGPMAVAPEFQNQGIGSKLVRRGLEECLKMEYEVVVVLGHPEYYPRFGFVPASRKGMSCEYPVPDDLFMVLELSPGALTGHEGLVRYHPEFSKV